MKKIYVDEELKVYTDDNAVKFLNEKSDLKYFNVEENGIHNVPIERWESAQKYERKTWMDNITVKDDRNYEHLERFNNLESLNGVKIDTMIELGCGPFTNVRLITDKFKPKHITLLDPLIFDYVNHPNCTYKSNKINDIPVNLISSPIENLDITEKFDSVIMINVIEHCYNVDIIFQKVCDLLNPGGVFIFSDVYFKDVQNLVSNIYDAGHPLRLSENKLNKFLENFNPLYESDLNGLYNQNWRSDKYYIGIKK